MTEDRMTALEHLLASLQADPSRVVAEHRGQEITAAAFLGRARAFAVQLRSKGLRPGDVLGAAAPDSVMAVQLVLASWMCGAATLSLDLRLSARDFAAWRDRMGLRLLIGPPTTRGGPDMLSPRLDLPPLEELPWSLAAREDAVADFLVSSGTTGLPKVRPMTQQDLGARIAAWLADPEYELYDTALSAQPVSFGASRWVWYRYLASGRKIVALDLLYTLRELDAALARPDVQDCSLPPVLIRRLGQLPPKGPGPRYPQLRKLLSVGGPATAEDQVRAVTRLTPGYSMTYSATDCGMVTRIRGLEILERPASCGRPVPGVRIEIRDGDRLCGPGEVGEIRVLRDGRDPVEPGDLGWLDEEGYLYIAGRSGGLMCRNGINTSVAEVEQALLACPLVEDAVVWPMADEDGGDRIHAVLECRADAEAAVAEFIRRDVSHKARPDHVVFRRRLPRTAGDKPDRRALIAEVMGGLGDGVPA